MACWQAYERQVDALGRALKRGEVDGQDLGQERHTLLQQLRAAEQVLPTYSRVSPAPSDHSTCTVAGPLSCCCCPPSKLLAEHSSSLMLCFFLLSVTRACLDL